ncbi:threonine aldolase like protein [Zymoseptoria brevis]|uniref:Threonine aldolase like protein n=1 Tax=Zymoseptoria brevis TaxID=1047168 RepID=A0A0F4GXG0_9PEZI|nr:threonine aldolase like protein [Zymoseptoria brevis]
MLLRSRLLPWRGRSRLISAAAAMSFSFPAPRSPTSLRSLPRNNMSTALNTNKIESEAHHLSNGSSGAHVPVNNWAAPGPTAFDFRSDTITTPTTRMLEAISATTLFDDVFQEDPTTNSLEAFIADLTGKDSGLMVMSGTMGNQIAIRSHLGGPPHSVAADARSHIIEWEAGGVASLCGAMLKPATPSNGKYVTLEDLQKVVDLREDVHGCPTKLISLENTIAGVVVPLEECQKISAWAKEKGLIMHLDGARIWEAVAAGAASLKDYCACFDSISLCFSKGLGAPIGSIIVGTKAFTARSRWVRKSIGGGIRQAGVITAAARVAVEDTFLGGKLQACHARAKQIGELWESYGGKTTNPVETNMVWLDLEAAGVTADQFIEMGQKAGLRLLGGRLVVHYQISDEAVKRLDALFQAVLKGKALDGDVNLDTERLKKSAPLYG